MNTAIYGLYWLVAVTMMVGSLIRFRHLLHPHVGYTAIVVVLLFSDFLARGYEDLSFQDIPDYDLGVYQLGILASAATMVGTAFIMGRRWRIRKTQIADLSNASRTNRVALLAALSILALDLWKRVYLSEWSLTDAIANSFAPFGTAPWNYSTGFLGDNKVFFQLIRTAMPLAGLLFGRLSLNTRGFAKWSNFVALVVVILLLAGEGARTPVIIVIFGVTVIYLLRCSTLQRKILVAMVGIGAVVLLGSMLYLFRTQGLAQAYEEKSLSMVTVVYHQDDNYYRAIGALHLADQGVRGWDPVYFLYVVVVNPIPRFLWPGKPALQADYYREYKDEWVTISLIGELAAMFGPWLGLILSTVVGICLFLLIGRASEALSKQGGIIMYSLVLLYVYMVMRSLLNVSQFIYLPAFGYAVYYLLNHRFVWR